MATYKVWDKAAEMPRVRVYEAVNVRSAAEAYHTSGVLDMAGPDSVSVTAVIPGRVHDVALSNGRTIRVAI